MEIVHFLKLPNGATFVVDGETFTKHEGLVYTDAFGLEHYIDPLFDAKLGKALAAQKAEAEAAAKAAETTEG